VAASNCFFACGSEVLAHFCFSFWALCGRAKRKDKKKKEHSAEGYNGIRYATA
jgi:hypothetical protein